MEITETIQVAIITSASTLFAVLITTIGTTFHLRHQLKDKREELLRDRAEELYGLINNWSNGLFSNYLFLMPVMKGEYDYDTYLDQIIDMEKSGGSERIEMIIHSYFPKLRTHYKNSLKIRGNWADIISIHKHQYKSGAFETPHLINEFTETSLELTQSCDLIKAEISNILRRI